MKDIKFNYNLIPSKFIIKFLNHNSSLSMFINKLLQNHHILCMLDAYLLEL